MTVEDLIETLRQRRALIVHCSRPGKGRCNGDEEPVFPDDLRQAMDGAARSTGGLSCSVIWPAHARTVGSVGIILRPRSAQSVSSRSASTTPAPTATGSQENAAPTPRSLSHSSAKAVADTSSNAAGYNEWIVDDAETVGIFVNLQQPPPPLVPRRISVGGHPPSPQPAAYQHRRGRLGVRRPPRLCVRWGRTSFRSARNPTAARRPHSGMLPKARVTFSYRNLAKEACSFVLARF